jgi:hypothetical protein
MTISHLTRRWLLVLPANIRHARALLAIGTLLCADASPSLGQDAPSLANVAQNPVASVISLPFELNSNFGVGVKDNPQYVLNIQPVVPFRLTSNWNLITRTIFTVVYQPLLAPGVGESGGLSDLQLSLFLSPAKPGAVIWGIGPIVGIPTGTKRIFGSGKVSVGPSAAALTIKGPWVVGAVANNLFSIAGEEDRTDVNQLLVQPFVNYNFAGGWYLTASPVITADWEVKADQRWTVPVGGGGGKIFRIGRQPLNASLQAFYNVEHPQNAAAWSARAALQFLFQK